MYTLSRSRHDVVIVGARVAGAATAMLLARLGHDVVVVDRTQCRLDWSSRPHPKRFKPVAVGQTQCSRLQSTACSSFRLSFHQARQLPTHPGPSERLSEPSGLRPASSG